MTPTRQALAVSLGMLALAGCSDDNNNNPAPTTFTVSVQNVSTPGLLSIPRAMGTVPLSPGAYAVFAGSDPMFTVGSAADAGTELIAEDGFPETKVMALGGLGLAASGMFMAAGGPDNGPAIFAGETATFTITAAPGDKLQLETMFVQSNDWFFAFTNGGLDLFDGSTPISGDVTDNLAVYDAGTEEDTAPGTGEFQKPVQDPAATDFGPADPNPLIRNASADGFSIPAGSAIIQVTITPM